MQNKADLTALLMAAMAGDARANMKPPADIRDQLEAAVSRHATRLFEVGELIYPKVDSEWRRTPGLPLVVLAVRPDAPPDYAAKGIMERGTSLDVRVGFWTPVLGINPIWAQSSDFEPYDDAKHGAAASSTQQAA